MDISSALSYYYCFENDPTGFLYHTILTQWSPIGRDLISAVAKNHLLVREGLSLFSYSDKKLIDPASAILDGQEYLIKILHTSSI
jgi:hypothetical protein